MALLLAIIFVILYAVVSAIAAMRTYGSISVSWPLHIRQVIRGKE